jgi:hypothetical protein
MPMFSAWLDGVRRVNRAPAILMGVWAITLLVSLPLTLAMRDMLARHLGDSLVGNSAAGGTNYDWMQEFADQASGLGVTFRPAVIGFGAVLDNLSAFLDDTSRPVVIVAAASAYLLLWMFAAGGILDRYARDRATRAHGFFSASGVFFFRFARLAAVQWSVYAILFGSIHPLLFDRLFVFLTRNLTVERTAFFTRAALYAGFALLLAGANLIFDYAKVRAVVEDRRSMLGAIAAALDFVAHNAGAAITLYAMNVCLFLATIALYAAVAPAGGGAGLSMWLALGIGQVYIAARLWVKLVFWASETALYQQRLAHAGYVARPEPVWPESPAAEALSLRR